ncbi:hotdog domain-containing protein [Lagierella sp.]|uniref:acyl-CoA thioesterase n=1 Tax=Lagierella sp. TaxID=2849657 RepID=UPI0026299B70|nr:hotdog domain-containing protein [Lagierella sp.]
MSYSETYIKEITKEMLNYYDFLHGGEGYKIMDATAGYVSKHYIDGETVTVACNDIVYKNSAYLGEHIVSTGRVERVGNTSITIGVENIIQERNILSSKGTFVMVSVDENFRPKPIDKKKLKR